MNKEKITLVISLILLFVYCANVRGVQIVEHKIISNRVTDCDMHRAKLLFSDNNNVLITMDKHLYANNNLIKIGVLFSKDEDPMEKLKSVDYDYCCNFLGSFVKDNQFYIAFDDVNTVNIYSIDVPNKKLELVNRIEQDSSSPNFEKVFNLSERENTIYLFAHYNKVFPNAIDLIKAGRSYFYHKPILAELQNNKIGQLIKVDYGGKTDESYIVHEIAAGKDSIHFFGFRNIDVPFIGKSAPIKLVEPYGGYELKQYHFGTGDYYINRDITRSIILYYADYDLKKEKNTRKYKIYENTPGYDEKTDAYCDYGVLSADTKDDNVFAVFSWVQQQKRYAERFNINNVKSDIYFWQCGDKSYSKAEKIAEGFCPLVRVDQFGIVHVFWVDRDGDVVQKVKKDGKWSSEEIILNGFNAKSTIYTKGCSFVDEYRPEAILYTKFFAAEFDKENNLHAVYPTADGVVYTKLKLE